MTTIVTRAGKGSALTHNELDTNFTNLNTDKVEASGDSMTGDLSFGDNVKAKFGASDDLQIYHDGTNSYVRDSGSGNLRLQANTVDVVNAANTEYSARFIEDGKVGLYYDGIEKLATTSTGIDVTGTVTADGLTVDTTTAVVDVVAATNDDATLFLRETGTGIVGAELTYDGGDNKLYLKVGNNSNTKRLSVDRDTGDISFYEDTGTTAKFFWDASAESLGIGTTSPSTHLDVTGGTTNQVAIFRSSDATATIGFADNTTPLTGNLSYVTVGAVGNNMVFNTNLVEAMRINSSGNVGIGTTSPAYALDVSGGTTVARFQNTSGIANLLLSSGGARASFVLTDSAGTNGAIGSTNGNGIAFGVGAAFASNEAMRIDSSGNLLVGTTSLPTDDNTSLRFGVSSAGEVRAAVNNGNAAMFKRATTDGDIVEFRKDSNVMGSIGVAFGNRLYVGNGDTGLRFAGDLDQISPWNTSTNAVRDGAIDLGEGVARFKNLYLSGGVYLGGTGAANLLDDYEEGTFTPVVEGTTTAGTGTYSYQFGYYTKIGREVKVYIRTAWTAHTGTGNMIVSGLPFTSSAANGYTVSAGSINIAQVAFPASTTSVVPVIAPSSTQIQITSIKDNLSNVALQMDSSCPLLTITISYFV